MTRTPVIVLRGKCTGKTGSIAGDIDNLHPEVTRIVVTLNGGGHAIIEIKNIERYEQGELKL